MAPVFSSESYKHVSQCEGNSEKRNQHAESSPGSTEQVVTSLVAELLCLLPSY